MINPILVAALDANSLMLGCYAVDESMSLPGVEFDSLVLMPEAPVETGRTILIPTDPSDPESPLVEVPVLGWPEAGWTYMNETWYPPT